MTGRRLTKQQSDMAQRRLTAMAAGSVTGESVQATRRSWAVGEFLLAHPEMSRARAEAFVDEIINRLDQAKGQRP